MLWTEITNLTTKEGLVKSGEEVRTWLRSLDDDDASCINETAAHVHVAMVNSARSARNHKVALRTPAEFRMWLEHRFQCSHVEFDVQQATDLRRKRYAARSLGVTNTNDRLPEVYFCRAGQDAPITSVTVKQGLCEPLAIEVRLAPTLPRGVTFKLELAYLGAKLGLRNAIRSYADTVSPSYRYLSRVRAARSKDGIKNPITQLTDAMLVKSLITQRSSAPYMTLEELTLLGLEVGHGTEVLQACVMDLDYRLLAWATLEIDVVAADEQDVGSLRLLSLASGSDYKDKTDPEFAAIYAQAGGRSALQVRTGICDTGVYDDGTSGDLGYLAPRIKAGHYFDAASKDNDRPTRPDRRFKDHFLVENPSKHGTTVAGQAAWGSERIELVDVMTKKGQTMGDMNDPTAARAFEWAIDQRVDIINCSAWMPFSLKETHTVVERVKRRVLFLATGGNSAYSFPLNFADIDLGDSERYPQKREFQPSDLPLSFENTLFVGGCTAAKAHHASRGVGPGVDVLVPSEPTTLYTPKGLVEIYRIPTVKGFVREFIRDKLQPKLLELAHEPEQIKEESHEYRECSSKYEDARRNVMGAREAKANRPLDKPRLDDRERAQFILAEGLYFHNNPAKEVTDKYTNLNKLRGGLDPTQTTELELLEEVIKDCQTNASLDLRTTLSEIDQKRASPVVKKKVQNVRTQFQERHYLDLEEDKLPGYENDLKDWERKLQEAEQRRRDVDNPKYQLYQNYEAVWDRITAWTGKPIAAASFPAKADETARAAEDTIVSAETASEWMRKLYDIAGVPHAWDTNPEDPDVKQLTEREGISEIRTLVRDHIQKKQVDPTYQDLNQALGRTHVSVDEGVSFGLPMVANMAAKIKLINRGLAGADLKRVIVDTSDSDPALRARAIAGGVINPLRAYFAAFDDEVTSQGREVHRAYQRQPAKGPNPARTLYYTFFYMNDAGLQAYRAIKPKLIAAYGDLDVELIEAEPPIEVESEPLTYVAGRPLNQHSWKNVIPVGTHPLYGGKKHLRLVLVNQCGYVVTKPLSTEGKTQRFEFQRGGAIEIIPPDEPATPDDQTAKFTVAEAKNRPVVGEAWSCRLQAKPNHVFPFRVQDTLVALKLSLPEPKESTIPKVPKNVKVAVDPTRKQLTITVPAGDTFDRLRDQGLSLTLKIKTVPAVGMPPPVLPARTQAFELDHGRCTVDVAQNETWTIESVTADLGAVTEWVCVLKVNDGELFAPGSAGLVELKAAFPEGKETAYGPSEDKYRVDRISDTQVVIEVTDAELNRRISQDCLSVSVEVNMVQTIGGNRDENEAPQTIFVTNKYHAGSSGTTAANDTLLVLFLHEIGHALGMVPKDHPLHYDQKHGGRGDHCAHNTEDVLQDDAWAHHRIPADVLLPEGDNSEKKVKVPVKLTNEHEGPPCVMYHTRTKVHHTSEFCPTCQDWVKNKLNPANWEWVDK